RTLKERGFSRPPGSPRLITRLRRIRELAVSRTGMITLVGPSGAGAAPSPTSVELADPDVEPGSPMEAMAESAAGDAAPEPGHEAPRDPGASPGPSGPRRSRGGRGRRRRRHGRGSEGGGGAAEPAVAPA